MTRKAVITGLGATSPIGGDVDTMWANALAGTSGARPIEEDWVEQYDLPVTFAAQLTNKPTEVLTRRSTSDGSHHTNGLSRSARSLGRLWAQ